MPPTPKYPKSAFQIFAVFLYGVGGMGGAIKSAALCRRHSYAGVSSAMLFAGTLCTSTVQVPVQVPLHILFTVPVHDMTKVMSEKGTTDFSQLFRAAHVWKIVDCAETHTISSPRGSKCCFP